MRRRRTWAALAALALLGGCARPAPPPQLAAAPRATPARAPAIDCSTTWVVLATVSRCGAAGFKLGVAAE